MNAGAVTEAVKTKFPMDKFVGIWWSGHDGDMKSVGEAGKGYRSLSWSVPDLAMRPPCRTSRNTSSTPGSR